MRRFVAAFAVLILSAGIALAQMITEDEVEAARQQYLAGNYEAAFAVLVPAAEQGDMVAQNIVGVAHQYGEFLPIDAKAAVNWFTASGNQGFGAAWHNLGYLYEVGMPGLQPTISRRGPITNAPSRWTTTSAVQTLARCCGTGAAERWISTGRLPFTRPGSPAETVPRWTRWAGFT